jgi:hypothetical protein
MCLPYSLLFVNNNSTFGNRTNYLWHFYKFVQRFPRLSRQQYIYTPQYTTRIWITTSVAYFYLLHLYIPSLVFACSICITVLACCISVQVLKRVVFFYWFAWNINKRLVYFVQWNFNWIVSFPTLPSLHTLVLLMTTFLPVCKFVSLLAS